MLFFSVESWLLAVILIALAEPYRGESLSHQVACTDAEIAFARSVPRSDDAHAATAVAGPG